MSAAAMACNYVISIAECDTRDVMVSGTMEVMWSTYTLIEYAS